MAQFNFIDSTGVIVADTTGTRDQVRNEYRAIYGNDIRVDAGIFAELINTETEIRDSIARNNAQLANQINPNQAGGPFFDALWALTGGQREGLGGGVKSRISAELNGVANTVIAAGSQARTTNGDLFALSVQVTLDGSGQGTGIFDAVESGLIPVDANTLTQIVSAVSGWEGVNNASAGTIGTLTQSDQSSRNQRRLTLALNGSGDSEAVISRVSAISGVRSILFRENNTSSNQNFTGDGSQTITVSPKSIYVCVHIDAAQDNTAKRLEVATAILAGRSVGAGFSSQGDSLSLSENVTDTSSGQVYPVLYQLTDPVGIDVRVTYQLTSIISNPVSIINSALLDYQNGQIDGYPGFVTGASVEPFVIASALNEILVGVRVISVETRAAGSGSFNTNRFNIGIIQRANISNISTIQQ